jgi:hypothetical protein
LSGQYIVWPIISSGCQTDKTLLETVSVIELTPFATKACQSAI